MSETTATNAAHGDANYKETIESILIAFILAFIFRAFVVEAYVIPTGSMAPTLYGAHMRFQCRDCGYTFDAGVHGSKNAAGDDVEFQSESKPDTNYHCPNCGYAVGTTAKQPIRFGDRILVLKYLYLFQKPVPGDVVVFKSPYEDPEHHVEKDPEYATNYIKRLIGVGPESIVLLDGDVYTGPYDAEKPLAADGKTPLFKIQRKPIHVQDVLWRVISNNDFIPHLGIEEHAWQQPWEEEISSSGWNIHGAVSNNWPAGAPSRIFDFSNKTAGGAIVFNPEPNQDTRALSDFLVYDEYEHNTQDWPRLFVSDLKLGADYVRKSGDGPFRLQLSKNADLFTAEVTPGKVSLLRGQRVSPDRPSTANEIVLETAEVSALAGLAPVRVELSNVDYRVSVRVDGKEVLATTDAQYSPNLAELWKKEDAGDNGSSDQGLFARPLVRIDAQRQESRIEHVVLSRDIYYLSHRRGTNFWATTRNISHIKEGEYFVMGDNSFVSGDARYWEQKVVLPREGLDLESGRVPERFMLGKAFFVYWPAGYRLPFLPVNAVPDFGEMRFIK